LARAPALHAGGHRFDSDILHKKGIASKLKKEQPKGKTFTENSENSLVFRV
jgi:hypothetical protein